MTRLPESGELGTDEVRDHFGGSGETSWPDSYYRGLLVPDIQQFTGNGFRSNDTGARFQVLRLFIHDGFNSGSPEGFYSINFDTTGAVFENSINRATLPPDRNAIDAIGDIEEAITDLYPAFEFSEVSHHTAQASSVEINCTTAAIQSGAHTIYLHGNFMNSGSVIAVDIPAGSDAGGIATAIENALESDERSLFEVDRLGNEITLRSTGRVNFWISDSADGETFSFPTSIWATRPAVRELEPEFGSRRETGNPPIDIGSDAGLSVFINTMQNANPPNSAVYDPCLLYTSPSPRDRQKSRMPSSA